MRLDWNLHESYEDIGGQMILRDSLEDAITALPREHLRQLSAVIVLDQDPRGKALGIWRQDHTGVSIELYMQPHITPLLLLPPRVRDFALRMHLAYTLFHEVGHHVTRFLNKRAAPPRKAARVEQKIERWADEYAEKRLGKLAARWLLPGGRADSPDDRRALASAVRAMRLEKFISLDAAEEASAGTKESVAAS